jgi:tetratricopeptide (TPR) repeat protein
MKKTVMWLGIGMIVGLWNLAWAESAQQYFELGQTLVKERRLNEAIQAFNRTLELDPTHGGAYVQMGFAYRLMEDYDHAKGAFLKAIALNPSDSSAHLLLGEIYNLKNMPEEAEREFDTYRRLTTQ